MLIDDLLVEAKSPIPTKRLSELLDLGEYCLRRGHKHNEQKSIALAIRTYETALRLDVHFPIEKKGDALCNLGLAYQLDQTSEKSENLKKSADALTQAAEVFAQIPDPEGQASALINLAGALGKLDTGSLIRNTDKAIDSCQQAVSLCTSDTPLWANATRALAIAYARRGRRLADPRPWIAKSIPLFVELERYYSGLDDSQAQVELWADLGTAYFDVAERSTAGLSADRSLIWTRKALEYWISRGKAAEIARAQNALGTSWHRRTRGDTAKNLFQAQKVLEPAVRFYAGRRDFETYADACHNLALIYSRQEQWSKLSDLCQLVVEKGRQQLSMTRGLWNRRRVVHSMARLNDFWVLAFIRLGDLAGAVAVFADSRQLFSAETDASSLTLPPRLIIVLVLPRGYPTEVIICWENAGEVYYRHQSRTDLTLDTLEAFMRGDGSIHWSKAYMASRSRDRRQEFCNALDKVGEQFSPIVERFYRTEGIPVSEVGWSWSTNSILSLLPVGSLDSKHGWQPRSWSSWLHGKAVEEPKVDQPRLLSVGDPEHNLQEAKAESLLVASLFKDSTVLDGEVTRDGLIKRLQEPFDCIHLSCHGRYVWGDPQQSKLQLGRGESLKIEDVWELNLKLGALVVLSACEVGGSDTRYMPSESFGFPKAFLQAGAGAVVAPLWPVVDVSSKYLVHRFLMLWQEGRPLAHALCEAQRWLRKATWRELWAIDGSEAVGSSFQLRISVTSESKKKIEPDEIPFSHPYYWAGFVLWE